MRFDNSHLSCRLPAKATLGDVALLLGDPSSPDYRRPAAIDVLVADGHIAPRLLH
jgi:hypothetical protein